jgi:hypothetical protein
MKAAKLGAIFMVSVMALAGLGAAYAHWVDEVNYNIKVDMGRLGFGYVSQWTNDPPPNYRQPGGELIPTDPPNDGTLDPDQPEGDDRICGDDLPPHPLRPKNVASTGCEMLNQKEWHNGDLMYHDDDPVFDIIEVTLYNVYPNYAPNLYFELANAGTIPIDITGHWLIDGIPGVDPDDMDTWIWMEKCNMYPFDLNGDGCDDIEIGLFCLEEDQQIDPCDRDVYGVSFHILQCYPQCTTLTFELKIFGVQWNWPVLPDGTPLPPWP